MDFEEEVPKASLDTAEIIRRGGVAYAGNEEYGLMKCPDCRHVVLYEYEADTVYTNPDDLSECEDGDWSDPPACVQCHKKYPQPWLDEQAAEAMKVSWAELSQSPWSWVCKETRK